MCSIYTNLINIHQLGDRKRNSPNLGSGKKRNSFNILRSGHFVIDWSINNLKAELKSLLPLKYKHEHHNKMKKIYGDNITGERYHSWHIIQKVIWEDLFLKCEIHQAHSNESIMYFLEGTRTQVYASVNKSNEIK